MGAVAVPGRPTAQVVATQAQAERAEAAARLVTVATPLPAPLGQRAIVGYRVLRNFSDLRRNPRLSHHIIAAGTVLTDKREVERLARAGAQLEAVFPEDAKPG